MVSASPGQTSWPQEAQCVEILGCACIPGISKLQSTKKGVTHIRRIYVKGERIANLSPCFGFTNPSIQDIGVNPFFDELFRHWNVRLRPGVSVIQIEVEDSDDEPSDFTDFMVVKDDPYEPNGAKNVEPDKTKMDSPMMTKSETSMETPLASMAAPVEPKVGDSDAAPVVIIDEVSPAKEDPSNTPKEAMEKTDDKIQQFAASLSAEDVDERIKHLKFFVQIRGPI